MLLLCTKHVHFTFQGETYIQTDGVAMGSPLGSTLSDICMVALENLLIPTLEEFIQDWSRYVDDTIGIVKTDSIQHVLNTLNSFHPNIQFTFETEQNNSIPFLDILLIRNNSSKIDTTVYRKSTHKDIYIHWQAFAPNTWKRGTLFTLTKRAYSICSNTQLLHKELSHLRNVFNRINNYPQSVITQTFQNVKTMMNTPPPLPRSPTTHEEEEPPITTPQKSLIILPYQGKNGDSILKTLKRSLNRLIPRETFETRFAYTGTKLATKFNTKDQIDPKHQHNVVYLATCPEPTCTENYIGKTSRRIQERVKDHSDKTQIRTYIDMRRIQDILHPHWRTSRF